MPYTAGISNAKNRRKSRKGWSIFRNDRQLSQKYNRPASRGLATQTIDKIFCKKVLGTNATVRSHQARKSPRAAAATAQKPTALVLLAPLDLPEPPVF